jgi:hypothetical protein
MKQVLYVAACLGLLLGFIHPLRGQGAATSAPEEALNRLRAETTKQVDFLFSELSAAENLHKRGFVSDSEVDFWRFFLAIASCDLAYEKTNNAAAVEQLKVAFEIRKRQLDRAQKLTGPGGSTEGAVEEARRRVATSAFRLAAGQRHLEEMRRQAKLVNEICEQEFERMQTLHRSGVGSDAELEAAHYRLVNAWFLRAKVNGDAKEAIRKAGLLVNIRNRKYEREKGLLAKGASSEETLADVLVGLLRAQYRLACEEMKQDPSPKDKDRLVSLTTSLVAVCEKRLELKNRNSTLLAHEKAFVGWEVAMESYRLALAMGGNVFEYSPFSDLDGIESPH